jgi:hypothetical protein
MYLKEADYVRSTMVYYDMVRIVSMKGFCVLRSGCNIREKAVSEIS